VKKYGQDPPRDVRKRLLDAFAEDLREYRIVAGLTQVQLAKRTNIHRTEISLLERGKREPRMATLIKLASALNVPLERLYERAVSIYEWVPRQGWREK
jgi:transcriptional regulator with XRE-family HTH domain